MAESYSDSTKDLIRQQTPWSEGVAWWVVLIQGILALGLGLYILFSPASAGIGAVQVLGIFLLLISILGAIRGLRRRVDQRAMPLHMLAAGIGLATGALIALNIWQEFLTVNAALVTISVGLALYGLAGLFEWLLGGTATRTWFSLGVSVLSVVLGFLVLWTRLDAASLALRVSGAVASVAGAGLLGYAFLLYRRQQGGGQTKPAQGSAGAVAPNPASEEHEAAVGEAAEETEQPVESG